MYSSSYDGIFAAESKVILELSQEPCIIVGRSANHVLTEAGIPAFHVFLYADLDKRIQRAAELGDNGDMDLRKYGSARHAGFGLGFERCVMYLTGITNIRDVLPFPRTVGNCEL